MKKLLFLFFLTAISLLLDAQSIDSDIVRVLPTIMVKDNRIDLLKNGLDIIQIDSIQRRYFALQGMDDILQHTTNLFIKDYGPAGISSLGIRGMGASQSMVYWNDVPLSSPNLGMTDIALLPASSFDHIAIQRGGGAALFGNGNMTGGLHLRNTPKFSKSNRLEWNGMLGSGHQSRTSLSYLKAGKRLFSKSQFFLKNDINDFKYYDLHRNKKRRKHAKSKQYSFIQDFAYQLDKRQWLHFGCWLQKANNQIPNTLTSRENDAVQSDENKRFFGKYYRYGKLFSWKVQSALLLDQMHYSDPDSITILEIDSKMQSLVWQNDIEISTSGTKKFNLFTNFYHKYEEAKSENYPSNIFRNRLGLRLGLRIALFENRWSSNIIVSQNFEKHKTPFLVSLNSAYKLTKTWIVKVHYSNNYRLPTFNDLYWIPLGNPNLKPEYSNNIETGLYASDNHRWKVGISAYYYDFQDRIVWLPKDGTWRPENMTSMQSKGVETHLEVNFTLQKLSHHISFSYAYVEAMSQEKCMPYVPQNSLLGYWDLSYKNTHLVVAGQFQSFYFVNADNSDTLPSNLLFDATLNKHFIFSKIPVDIQLKVKNILDHEYQIISFYPMPGRSLELSIKLGVDFIKK